MRPVAYRGIGRFRGSLKGWKQSDFGVNFKNPKKFNSSSYIHKGGCEILEGGKQYFISVEGGEGAGKSTFMEGLAAALTSGGHSVVKTFEPGGTEVASRIRHLFTDPPKSDPLHMKTELLLVCAARTQHVEKLIKPSLAAGKVVLCDRYSDSTRVYQGVLGSNPQKELEQMIAFAEGGCTPTITFLLDAPVEVLVARLDSRGGGSSRFDLAPESVHRRIRQAYLNVANQFKDRIQILDASQDQASILRSALDCLAGLAKDTQESPERSIK